MLLYSVVYCVLQNDRQDGYVFALEMFGVDGHMDLYWYNYMLLYSVVYCVVENDGQDGYVFALEMFGLDGHMDL